MSDAEYLAERALQEMKAAIRSLDRRVREVHLEMADAYSFRLSETKRLAGQRLEIREVLAHVEPDTAPAVEDIRPPGLVQPRGSLP